MKPKKVHVLGVIPARYGSTRLTGKPLIDLCGKPMVQHTYERASRAASMDALIIATDDGRIYNAVKKFGGTAVMTPTTCTSGSDRIAHVLRELFDADIAVNIQVDQPLLDPMMIDECVQGLLDDRAVEVATLVKRISDPADLENSNIPKVVLDRERHALYFSRAMIPLPRDNGDVHELLRRHLYYKHIGLYVYRRAFLFRFTAWKPTPLEEAERLEQLRALEHGVRIRVVETRHDSVGVDTPDDLARVQRLLERRAWTPSSSS